MNFAIYNPKTQIIKNVFVLNLNEDEVLIPESELPPEAHREVPPPEPKTWPNYEFYRKFTPMEKGMFEAACAGSPELAVLRTTLTVEPTIFELDPNLQAGLDALVALGILTKERKAEILS